jgi:hypothetical protein
MYVTTSSEAITIPHDLSFCHLLSLNDPEYSHVDICYPHLLQAQETVDSMLRNNECLSL